MKSILATLPWELVHIDFTTIEVDIDLKKSHLKYKNMLALTDHFTRFSQAHIVPGQTAKSIAKYLYEDVFLVSSAPGKLLSNKEN